MIKTNKISNEVSFYSDRSLLLDALDELKSYANGYSLNADSLIYHNATKNQFLELLSDLNAYANQLLSSYDENYFLLQKDKEQNHQSYLDSEFSFLDALDEEDIQVSSDEIIDEEQRKEDAERYDD